MAPDTLTELLKLPSGERAELAMALWASLDDAQRGAELALTTEQAAELDPRFAEHEADPSTALPWEDVLAKTLEPAVTPRLVVRPQAATELLEARQ